MGQDAQVCEGARQPPVLIFEGLNLAHRGSIHAAKFRSPFVGLHATDLMLAATLRNGQPALRRTQHALDFGFGETTLLRQNLLVHLAKENLRTQALNHEEDYPSDERAHASCLRRLNRMERNHLPPQNQAK